MVRYEEIYKMIKKLYDNKKYQEVINSVEKYLKLDFLNKNFEHNMHFYKAKSLRYLGRFDEAISELKKLSKYDNDNLCSVEELFYIYYYLNRYEEALELLPILYNNKEKSVSNHTLLIIEIVMKTHLGIPVSYRKGSRSDYIKEQIINYSSQKALEHIIAHKYEDYSKNIHSRFNENVNIEYLMECVKNNINNSEKRNKRDSLEVHCFSIFGIGYDNNTICNYLNVVVCPNTTNIITMYPFSQVGKEEVKILDCDFDRLFNRKKEERSTSMIDKFNNRFNLKR